MSRLSVEEVLALATARLAVGDSLTADLIEARATVAELVALGWQIEEWLEGIEDEDSRAPCILRDNFRAALAKFGGAA